jgi:hypothetical protein
MFGGTWIRVLGRAEFLERYWSYHPGEHVAVLGPTQISGKTRLIFDLLAATDTQDLVYPPVVLVAKPKDRTVDADLARLGYQRVEEWPPRRPWYRANDPEPAGYAFWPSIDPDLSSKHAKAQLARQFETVIDHQFWAGREGPTLTVADEAYGLIKDYGMADPINRHMTQGMGMGAGLWYATQKPSGTQSAALSGFLFNSATHTFVARDPVKSNRRKYEDIGGVESGILEDACAGMPPFTFLYIHRVGPKLAVVLAD